MNLLAIINIFIQIAMCEYDNRILTTTNYSSTQIVPRVINGAPALMGQMPYLVSIKSPLFKKSKVTIWSNLCGGSIIDEKRVLTAAHCFEYNNFYYASHPSKLRVVAGNLHNELAHSGRTETTGQAQWRKIKKIDIHHRFVFPAHDIAVLNIDISWKFTFYVNFAVPASRRTDYIQCYSAGYGRIGHYTFSNISDILLIAPIFLLPHQRCNALWEMNMDSYICSDSVITDVTRGDSGSPLGCTGTLDPAEIKGKDLIVGVVSGKSYDKTTLYTRVSHYKDWIDKPPSVKEESISDRGLLPGFSLSLRLVNIFMILMLFYSVFYCIG